MIRVLVADDEANITDSIAYALKREGYDVECAYDGEETLKKITKFCPHILVLDLMMPVYDGYEVCRRIDPDTNMGILMLTAKNDLMDKVVGLELGADDYVTKPFDLVELLARIRSLVRRLKKASGILDNVEMDSCDENNYKENEDQKSCNVDIKLLERLVYVDGEEVEFKPKEFDLLVFLAENNGRVFSREQILESVWDMDYLGGTRTIDIHIQRIRKKLGDYAVNICTVPRVGYKAVDFEGVFS